MVKYLNFVHQIGWLRVQLVRVEKINFASSDLGGFIEIATNALQIGLALV
jgi:hypothetical protein